MATTQYILRGKMEWLYQLFVKDEKYNKYSVDVYLTEDSWKTFNEIGLELKVREKDGENYVRFSRKHSQLIKDQMVEFGPPKVYSPDGELLTEIGSIGNGTEGMVRIEVYDTSQGKGHRLLEVSLINIVEYEADPDAPRKAPEVVSAADVVPFAS